MVYLEINKHVYDTDERKILFMVSYCQGGTAGIWAETFVNTRLLGGNLGTWTDFQTEFVQNFLSSDAAGEAKAELMRLRQTGPADEYVAQFKILTSRSGITDYEALVELFQRGLQKPLLTRIYNKDTLPTDMDGWYKAAQHMDHQWRRMRRIIEGNAFNSFSGNRQQNQAYRDPNAMDVDHIKINRLSAQDKERYFKEGRCFSCGEKGHRSANCPKKRGGQNNNYQGIRFQGNRFQKQPEQRPTPQGNYSQQRNVRQMQNTTQELAPEGSSYQADPETNKTPEYGMPAKERATKIRALLSGMQEEEREAVLDQLAEQGFA